MALPSVPERIVELLNEGGGSLPDRELMVKLSLSRSSLLEHLQSLERWGYTISCAGSEYRLDGGGDVPLGVETSPFLDTSVLGRRVEFHETIDSTNREAVERAAGGAPEGTVVVADSQSRGRGRFQRFWDSPPGVNLYFSTILRPDVGAVRLPELPLLTAAALHQALTKLVPSMKAVIKWPNDILVGERKLAGILCESKVARSGAASVVVGIGLNVNGREFDPSLEGAATSLLLKSGRRWSRPEVMAGVLNRLEYLYDDWVAAEDLKEIVPYLEEYSSLIGRRVEIAGGGSAVTGVARAISPAGKLIVESPDGTLHYLSAGDVSLKSPRAPSRRG